MIGLIQRVCEAQVTVAGERVARIDAGLLVLVGVQRGDGEREAVRLAERLVGYRVFADQDNRMNRSLADTGGELLLVPQFTLAADTRKGMRASFTTAATPAAGRAAFEALVTACCGRHARVASGRFGADMQVALINDGPVTFWLEVRPA